MRDRNSATFVPIPRHRLSDAVVEQLAQFIESGTYAIGEKLPSERELSAEMGVSRTLIRESLRILESIGLVKVKPGVGALINRNSRRNIEIENFLLAHATDVLEVVEVRDILAARGAELAARRITDDQLLELQVNYAAQRTAASGGAVDELVRLDNEFHLLIYRAAENKVLLAMEEHSRAILYHVHWSVLTLATRREKSLEEHGRICDALHKRDARAAGSAARAHAQRSITEIRKVIEQGSHGSHAGRYAMPASR